MLISKSEDKIVWQFFLILRVGFNMSYMRRILKLTAIVATIASGFINLLWKKSRWLEILQVIDMCYIEFSVCLIILAREVTQIQGHLPALICHSSAMALKRWRLGRWCRAFKPVCVTISSCLEVEKVMWSSRIASHLSPSCRDRKGGAEEGEWNCWDAPEHAWKMQG